MSIRLMNAVWDMDLPDSEKLVMLSLADNANDHGVCWPSIATIARRCSKSERTVQRTIRSLETGGHLSSKDIAGRGREYTLHPRHHDTGGVTSCHRGGDTVSQKGCHHDTQTIKEPPIEPPLNLLTAIGDQPEPVRNEEEDLQMKIAEAWNGMAIGAGLPSVRHLTDKRSAALRARIKDYGAPKIIEAISHIPSRPFLVGKGGRGWKADFDFLIKPDSVAKILEGLYATGGSRTGWGSTVDAIDDWVNGH